MLEEYVANIVKIFNSATAEELHEGMHWYDNTRALALELSPDNVWRGAGVIAAYSPMCHWDRNVLLAKRTFETGKASGHTKANVNIAQRIYDGEHPLMVMKGDKTRAFTAAIADPNTSIATIDRHAYDIAKGRVHTEDERKIGKRVYLEMSEAYAIAAKQVGLTISQIQAVTWVVWRNTLEGTRNKTRKERDVMHLHTFAMDENCDLHCPCGVKYRFANQAEAVHIQDTDAFATDGPMVWRNNCIIVPEEYSIWVAV